MSDYRTDRSLLLERDPQKLSENIQITSIKHVDWRHQQMAASKGYSSVTEMAVDELLPLLGRIAELEERVSVLEGGV